jgi:glyoxylase-like metal-dependent hydrolase (beta-lactamase superfamily II)
MKIKKFFAPPLEENSYILYSEINNTGFIIDPGSKPNEILSFVEKNKITIKSILNTHGHFDHTVFNQYISDKLNIPILLNDKDLVYTENIKNFIHLYNMEIPLPKKFKQYSDSLSLDNKEIKIIETPGHTPGSVSYYIPSEKIIFTGDTLFRGVFGRYDLPGGNFDTLKLSIKSLFNLSNDVVVYSGHGAETTIGREKETNYILNFI